MKDDCGVVAGKRSEGDSGGSSIGMGLAGVTWCMVVGGRPGEGGWVEAEVVGVGTTAVCICVCACVRV